MALSKEIQAKQKAVRKRADTDLANAKNEVANRKTPTVQRQDLGKTPQIAKVNSPEAANLGDAGQDMRSMSLDSLKQLQGIASGEQPSIAQQRFKQNIERALAAQQAQASTTGSPLAQRQAAMQGQQMMQQSSNEAAILGQQERDTARQALLQGSSQVRGQDLQQAQANAAFQQQANMKGADFAQQTALQQAQMQQRQGFNQAQLNQQANLTEAGFQQQQNQALNALVQQGLQQGLTLDQAQINAQIQQQQFEKDLAFRGSEGDANRTAQRRASQRQTWGQIAGGLLGAGGAIGAAVLSDKNEKENITSGEQSVQSFLDAITANDFNYKGQAEQKTGIMAQDLEKSPVGQNMVTEVNGTKMVEPDFGVMLASLAQINKRLKNLEGV